MTPSSPWLTLAVLGIAAATFLPALHNGLFADDVLLLHARLDALRSPSLLGLFGQSYWGDLHTGGLYRPLSLIALKLQRDLFGTQPEAYRLVNLVLHGLCSVLVLRLLGRWTPPAVAAGGALLFAAHPIHAEAVTTIYGQQDLLAGVFFVAALTVYLRKGSTNEWRVGIVAGSLYFLSLLAKEQGVLLPVLALALRRLEPGGQESRLRLTARELPLIAALASYAVLRVAVLGANVVPMGEASVVYGYPWWARINLVIVTVGTYITLLVFPWGQTTHYGHLRDSLFGFPLREMAVLLAALVVFRPLQVVLGARVVVAAYAFFVLTVLPVANILPIGVVVAERCLYLPALAFCLLAAAGVHRVRPTGLAAQVAICALVVTGMLLSARVAFRWRTPVTHWQTTAEDHPRAAGAHARYALALLAQAARERPLLSDPIFSLAENAIERASKINPRLADVWHARGLLALIRGDCDGATDALNQALLVRPGDPEFTRLLAYCR